MTAEWATAIGTLGMALGACIGAWAGLRGVNAWRAEVVGRRKAELAEEVLALFYRARDVLIWARLPSDVAAREQPGSGLYAAAVSTPVERLTLESQLFSELQAGRYRFMAYFGKAAAGPFDEVRAIHAEIVKSAEQLARDQATPGQAAARARGALQQSIGWGRFGEDSLAKRLDEAILAVEDICRPLIDESGLRRRSWLRRLMAAAQRGPGAIFAGPKAKRRFRTGPRDPSHRPSGPARELLGAEARERRPPSGEAFS